MKIGELTRSVIVPWGAKAIAAVAPMAASPGIEIDIVVLSPLPRVLCAKVAIGMKTPKWFARSRGGGESSERRTALLIGRELSNAGVLRDSGEKTLAHGRIRDRLGTTLERSNGIDQPGSGSVDVVDRDQRLGVRQ